MVTPQVITSATMSATWRSLAALQQKCERRLCGEFLPHRSVSADWQLWIDPATRKIAVIRSGLAEAV